MTLPGSVSDQVSVDLPEEVRVAIHPDGAVEVNEAILGEPADQELRVLRETLQRFRESADNNHTQSLVTLDAANQTTHQRIVDVLNACARARIKGVTLNSDEETEEAE
jgi:biopolymer transport protein ExbD